jgi:hypothetical protein
VRSVIWDLSISACVFVSGTILLSLMEEWLSVSKPVVDEMCSELHRPTPLSRLPPSPAELFEIVIEPSHLLFRTAQPTLDVVTLVVTPAELSKV